MAEFPRDAGEIIPYPEGAARALLRVPLLLFRLGLGPLLSALPLLILTTRGRRTGLPRHTPIVYARHGNKLYIVSAWGTRPAWYKNLLANPRVTVQVGGRRLAAQARPVDSEGEVLRVLQLYRRRVPWVYDPVIARLSGRDSVSPGALPEIASAFTVVRLDRLADEPLPLPPVEADLTWITGLGLGVLVLSLALIGTQRARRAPAPRW